MKINAQAEELNGRIKKLNRSVAELLSEKGRAIYFPKKGILSQSADAKGKEINATIGMALEEDGSSMCLKNLSGRININKDKVFPYAPSYGRPDLRAAWKKKIIEKNSLLKEAVISLPVVTGALTHGLNICGYLFGNPGDKIIMPDLFWGNYRLIFCNANELELNLFKTFDDNGGFNVNGLKEKLAEGPIGKKIVLLNFPNNPTGYTPTVDEVKMIREALLKSAEEGNKIVVIIDDAYFGLVYEEGIYARSIFTELFNLHSNILAVKVDGPTKEDYIWGFRVGFITYGIKDGNEELCKILEDKTAGAVRATISNASNLSQSLLLAAFEDDEYDSEKASKHEILRSRYIHVKKILKEKEDYKNHFEPLPFNSGYFMCIKLKKAGPEEVRQVLLKKYSTGVIAINGIIRVAFSATPDDKLDKLFDNIYQAAKSLAP